MLSRVWRQVRHGLDLVPGIESVEGDTFTFVDGRTFKADYVVCCTGFTPRFPFLEGHHPELASIPPRSLFKRCLLPPSLSSEVGEALFFGGVTAAKIEPTTQPIVAPHRLLDLTFPSLPSAACSTRDRLHAAMRGDASALLRTASLG